MAGGTSGPPPLPSSSALATLVGPREDLPPLYRDPIERFAREHPPGASSLTGSGAGVLPRITNVN